MGCFRDCFDDNKDSEDREQLKSKRNKCLLIIYYAILFSYGLAILILSLLAESAFQTLPNSYNDFIANWNQNPIIDIIASTQGTCSGGYEQLFQVQNPNGQTLTSWWDYKTSFGICVKRQSGYSFAQRYPNGPKCDFTTQQMCGGTYVENKFCMPINSSCPINNIQILNYSQYSNYSQDKIQFTINLTNNFYLIASNLDQYLPIADIRITTGNSACDSQNSDYSEIFYSAFCGNNDIRYTQIHQIGTQNYSYANNISPQSVNSNVGLYKRNYISWTLECRQKFLAQKAINAQSHYIIMSVLQVALVIASGINFGFVGCIFGLYGLIRMIVIEDTSKVGRQCHKMVRQTLLGIKILIQTGHAVILILAFSYAIDQKIFIDRVILLQCSDPTTMAIFTYIQQNVISSLYFYDLIIFSLFFIVTVLECFAFYVFLHNSIRTKIREERYNEINHSNIISEPTHVNYLMNAGFTSQMTVQQTQPKYVTPTPQQQHRTQELQVISPIRPPPVQQQNNNTPKLPPINNQNYYPPNQIQSRDNNTAPQQNQNFLQFESFSGSSNQFQSQGLGQRMESGQGQKSPIDYQTQQQNVIREEREEDRQGYQSQDLPKYKPKYYQE